MTIKSITARKILASMGNETVEATIKFGDGSVSSASVPAGISAGKYEIKKVSADQALIEISKISAFCSGKEWTQEALDEEISKHGFGGNATLAVSAALYKKGVILDPARMTPKLMLLVFEGAEHGNPEITIQEFLVVEETIHQAEEDFHKIRESVPERTVGAEGGFSPRDFDNEKVLAFLRKNLPDKKIAIDMAGSFRDNSVPDGIMSVEDPFDDESWSKWQQLMKDRPDLQIVGDDLTATNPDRIKKAIELSAINAVVIKPNQIGTISGAKEAVAVARAGGLKIIVSHRGEETDDTWIVDFALDVGADYVKFGGMDRGERVAKYNRLRELGLS